MTRLIAVVAPALMLLYGLCRYADGLDGDRGNEWTWDAGHVAFFIAIVLFAVLGDRLRRALPSTLTVVAEAAAVFGAACMLWVITGDIFDSFPSLPNPLNLIGSVLFELGLLVLLVRHVMARRLPVWSPVLVAIGFTAPAASLDLLPLAAVVVGVGLLPLVRNAERAPVRVG